MNQQVNCVYFLEKGYVKIGQYTDGGKEIILTILKPGEWFGNLRLNNSHVREFAEPLTDIVVRKVHHGPMNTICKTLPNLVHQLFQAMDQRMMMMEFTCRNTSNNAVQTRLINFLLFMGERFGQNIGGTIYMKNILTHREIATITNCTRQAVSGALSKMKKANIINYDRHQIKVYSLKKEPRNVSLGKLTKKWAANQ